MVLLCCALAVPGRLSAQSPVPSGSPVAAEADAAPTGSPVVSPSLFDQEPYDLLVLNDDKQAPWKLVPLDLPRRRLPVSPAPTEVLQVRLFDNPDKKYEVAWRDIAEVRLFEQLLLDEARRLLRENKFRETYDFILHFRREKPSWPEIGAVETELLQAEAEAALARDDAEFAVVRLLRLTEQKEPSARTRELLSQASQRQMATMIQREQFAAARSVVERFGKSNPNSAEATALRKSLADEAERHAAAVERALTDEHFEQAQAEARAAVALSGGDGKYAALLQRAMSARSVVRVGVAESAESGGRLDREGWAERRLADLRQPALLRPSLSLGDAQRLTYESRVCELSPDDRDPTLWHLRLSDGAPTATEVTAALVENVGIPAPLVPFEIDPLDRRRVDLRPRRAHPNFEALIADRLRMTTFPTAAPVPFRLVEQDAERSRWVRRAVHNDGTVDEVIERRFPDETAAVQKLLAGHVDVVDRLAPWQAAELRGQKQIVLKPYAAASVHLLLFNGRNPVLRDAQLRRAVAYAIDRESILQNHLRPEAGDLGSRTATGLFPVGRSAGDPLGYANDLTVKGRRYEPSQAFVLAALARTSVVKKSSPAERPLRLLHPATATAAVACRRIAAYLESAGIPVELEPAPPERSPTAAEQADLVYAVVSSVEPASDAIHWLGTTRLVNLESPSLQANLAKLAAAESPVAVRAVLFELQRLVHEEVLLVPLWQLTEYAAFRGPWTPGDAKRAAFGLYQDVDTWRMTSRVGEASR